MLISISVGYDDVNSSTPRLRMHLPKRRLRVRKKSRPATDLLKKLRRQLTNIRSQIIRRLDALKFRTGDAKKLAEKRTQANKLAIQYNNLKRRIATMEKARKAVGA